MPSVLILCTGNSCRSQMAEALWQSLGQGNWRAASAGSRPAGYVHPLAVRVMHELGIDLSGHASKSLDRFVNDDFDLVVTVCDNARDVCPVFPGAKQTLHWPFDDPAHATGSDDQRLAKFRRVRDEIRARILRHLSEGGTGGTP
jgi:arsenate reductase